MPFEASITFSGMKVWTDPDRCTVCNRTVNRDQAILESKAPPYRPLPLSLTSCGFFVASRRFRSFALDHNFQGIDFIPLSNKYFVVKTRRKVRYANLESICSEQQEWCVSCKSYRNSIVGNWPRTVAKTEPPIAPLEFAESHLRFGTEMLPSRIGWTAMHADLLVGDEAMKLMKEERFKAITFVELKLEI